MKYGVVRLMGGIFDSCVKIFTFQERIIRENLFKTRPMSEKFQKIGDPDALTADAWTSSTLAFFDGDPLQSLGIHFSIIPSPIQ